jgi:tetratricopeptide (TPR) repeat protein
MLLHTRVSPFARCAAGALLAGVLLAGCNSTQRQAQESGLYPGFGAFERTASTDSEAAQELFNQAMQLLYGFNHDEAIRTFEKAAEHDPNFAMAYWGVAYANGLHINNPEMTEVQSERAYAAAQEALQRIQHASPVEQALIHAVSKRYAMPIPEDRAPLDRAYANAMEQVWSQFPHDPDVGALYAESLMNLQPWDLWTRDGKPKGRTLEIVATLERVMELDPDHPGANHFYIHTMEASPWPERALASADLLRDLVPGSGHLVHMPAHIYARLGQWDAASDANGRAIKADRKYFALAPEPEFYGLYYVHNMHFLAWSAMMEGRFETALQAAREVERDIPAEFLRKWPQFADGFMPVTYHVMIRFGKWEEILEEPAPPEFRHISRAMRRYARGVALSALGRVDEAREELEAFEKEAALIPADWKVGQNMASDVMPVARHMLTGELLFREGEYDAAFAQLRQAVTLEEALVYDEPPGWMQPVRHALGALLMATGRADEAERVYRDDLALNPHNGWALLGLEQALKAQGKADAAREFAAARGKVWKRADVSPTSSCYCAPAQGM